MKQKKLIIGLASVLLLTLVVIGLKFSRRRAGDLAVGLSFVGYTNANGTNMALFKVQNNQSRRIWLRHCYYLAGEAFREPSGAWQCSDQAASNRWGKSSMDLRQYLPPEPTRTSPDPTNLVIAVPTNQLLWRIGVTVEFDITLPRRIRSAWKPRDWWMLNPHQFINNSPEAIWVESAVITNALVLPDGAANNIRAQSLCAARAGLRPERLQHSVESLYTFTRTQALSSFTLRGRLFTQIPL